MKTASVASTMAMGAAIQQCRMVIWPVQKLVSWRELEVTGAVTGIVELFMKWHSR
jgi:hypothetical protein